MTIWQNLSPCPSWSHVCALLAAGSIVVGSTRADPPGYKLEKTVAVPGDGGWDYLSVDDEGRRVYVSHGTCVEVLDADSGELKGQVADWWLPERWAFLPEVPVTSVGKFDKKVLRARNADGLLPVETVAYRKPQE